VFNNDLQAMGIETDQEIVQLVGTDPTSIGAISASFEECVAHNVYNSRKALDYIPPSHASYFFC